MAGRLARDYALVRAREYGPDAATRLINDGYLAVILDGLDEMAEKLHPVVLQALDEQATFRLVLLTRTQEMVATARDGHLRGTAALELCPVQAEQAAEYLASAQLDPAPTSWQRLVRHLREHPDSALAQALDTPLMVNLVRDTYRPNDPDDRVDELTDGELFASRESIENHLLDRVLPAAYTPRPGHPAPAYTLDQAQHWLGNLARRMNAEETRDLAWWQIPQWVPAWRRVAATVVAYVLVVFLLLGSGVGLARALVSTLGLDFPLDLEVGFTATVVSKLGLALTIGPIIGLMSALGERDFRYLRWLRRSKTDIRKNLRAGLLYGLTFGLMGGLMIGIVQKFVPGIVYGLVIGLLAGSVVGLVGAFGESPPRHLGRPQWHKTDIPINIAVGLVTGLAVGLIYGLVARNGLRSGFMVGFAAALMIGLVTVFGRPSTEATSPIDPRSSWRWNRQLGLTVGLMSALMYGLGEVLWHAREGSLVVGLLESLAVGIAVGLIFPVTWQYTLASAQLWWQRETPARLLRFLEDARDRKILRTVGEVYQFRHARLQDRLASEADSRKSDHLRRPCRIESLRMSTSIGQRRPEHRVPQAELVPAPAPSQTGPAGGAPGRG